MCVCVGECMPACICESKYEREIYILDIIENL